MGMSKIPKKKVTGIGGIFFKCNDPKRMNEWYEKNLGIPVFEWGEKDDPEKEGYTVWSTFPSDTKDFDPSKKDFRINYRVENIESLVEELKNANVTITDEIT